MLHDDITLGYHNLSGHNLHHLRDMLNFILKLYIQYVQFKCIRAIISLSIKNVKNLSARSILREIIGYIHIKRTYSFYRLFSL